MEPPDLLEVEGIDAAEYVRQLSKQMADGWTVDFRSDPDTAHNNVIWV